MGAAAFFAVVVLLALVVGIVLTRAAAGRAGSNVDGGPWLGGDLDGSDADADGAGDSGGK
jgi:hypothetical protein